MEKKKRKDFVSIILLLVVVLLVALGVGLILKYTNGGNESFKTFYVQYGSEKILSTDTEKQIKFDREKLYYFEVGYPFDIGTQGASRDFSVKIEANRNIKFDYTLDGIPYPWTDEAHDLSQFFDLNKQSSSFTLRISDNTTLQSIMQDLYADKTVVLPAEEEINSKCLFTIVVSSYDEKITYRINFSF